MYTRKERYHNEFFVSNLAKVLFSPEHGLAEQKGEGTHVPNCSAENTNLIPTPELWKHLPTAPW